MFYHAMLSMGVYKKAVSQSKKKKLQGQNWLKLEIIAIN